MESKYLLAVLVIAAIAALSIGIAGAHTNNGNQMGSIDDDFGMMGMGGMMGMMNMMSGNMMNGQNIQGSMMGSYGTGMLFFNWITYLLVIALIIAAIYWLIKSANKKR